MQTLRLLHKRRLFRHNHNDDSGLRRCESGDFPWQAGVLCAGAVGGADCVGDGGRAE
jgi:hypothetical protein